MDDIQDNSTFREDFPVAHSMYGFSNTINAASYAQLIALEKVGNLHPEVNNYIIYLLQLAIFITINIIQCIQTKIGPV